MQAKYASFILKNKNVDGKKFFGKKGVKEWKYWKLIKVDFPYDKIASRHDLLVPRRKLAFDSDMHSYERLELQYLKKLLSDQYDCFLENSTKNRTFKDHYHLHCIAYKLK